MRLVCGAVAVVTRATVGVTTATVSSTVDSHFLHFIAAFAPSTATIAVAAVKLLMKLVF